MNFPIKRTFHLAGSLLAIVGVVFVILKLYDYSANLDFSRFDLLTWCVMTGLALIYGLANIMLTLAWRDLLIYFGVTSSRLWAVKVYGLSQIAKYIPGNIMHLAGRQAMGQAAGIPGWPLAKASMWELGLISIAGAFFAVLALPQFLPFVTPQLAAIGFVGILLIVVAGIRRYMGMAVTRAFGWYIVFLVISGMVFVGVLVQLMGEGFLDLSNGLIVCGAFVVAWLIGLVTPGAPAGVGVRELVLVILLKGLVNESDLLLAVLISRLVTVSGDVLFFLLASFLPSREAGVSNRCLDK